MAAAAALLLRRNGYRLEAGQDDVHDFTLCMATGAAGQDEARQWLAAHAVADGPSE